MDENEERCFELLRAPSGPEAAAPARDAEHGPARPREMGGLGRQPSPQQIRFPAAVLGPYWVLS